MVDIRSLISQIPMEPGYVPAPPEPDLSVIQRLMGLPQTLRAVGQNLAVGAASLPVGIYQGFGDPSAGEAAMSQFQQDYGYTPTNPAAQRQLQGLGEFLQQLETEYKIPPMISPSQLPSRAATRWIVMQLGRIGTRMTGQAQNLARDLVREIQTTPPTGAVTMAPSSLPKVRHRLLQSVRSCGTAFAEQGNRPTVFGSDSEVCGSKARRDPMDWFGHLSTGQTVCNQARDSGLLKRKPSGCTGSAVR
jgi:hypothetical protein